MEVEFNHLQSLIDHPCVTWDGQAEYSGCVIYCSLAEYLIRSNAIEQITNTRHIQHLTQSSLCPSSRQFRESDTRSTRSCRRRSFSGLSRVQSLTWQWCTRNPRMKMCMCVCVYVFAERADDVIRLPSNLDYDIGLWPGDLKQITSTYSSYATG